MDLPFEKLKEKYLSLPPELREAISSSDMAEALYAIGQANGLRIDEMDTLSKQTGLVLLGVTHPSDYVAKLRDALPMSQDAIEAIARAVNEKIFGPIRDSILTLHAQPATAPTPAAPGGATAKPGPSTPPSNLPFERTLPNDMVQARMEGSFRLAPDSVTVKKAPPIAEGKYRGPDPYREPTE